MVTIVKTILMGGGHLKTEVRIMIDCEHGTLMIKLAQDRVPAGQ